MTATGFLNSKGGRKLWHRHHHYHAYLHKDDTWKNVLGNPRFTYQVELQPDLLSTSEILIHLSLTPLNLLGSQGWRRVDIRTLSTLIKDACESHWLVWKIVLTGASKVLLLN